MAKDLRPVYTAVNEAEAKERFIEFCEIWCDRYPAVRNLWENAWTGFVPFLDYSAEIRRVIYSTNAIESLHARMRRATRARGHFPNEQAALKCLYLVVRSLDPTGRGRERWMNRWKPALNAFAIAFDGRLFPIDQRQPPASVTPLTGQSLTEPPSAACDGSVRASQVRQTRTMSDASPQSVDDLAELTPRVDAAAALNRLSHALVGHRADPDVLRRIAAAADRLAAEIEDEPRRDRGGELSGSPRFAQAVLEGRSLATVVEDGAFIDMFHDSPVSGSANPLTMGLRIGHEGDTAIGVVTLQDGWEGAPGRSHGGVVAACVDETIGGLLPLIGEMAFTGELSLRYEGPCPMREPITFRAWLERREGRKLFIACTGTARGTVFVRAHAVFITVDLERFRAS